MRKTTNLQKRAADDMIAQGLAGGKIIAKKALIGAGYSESVANKPQVVTESKGFKAYMASHGITEDCLALYLAEDLSNKPGERLGEMKLAAELMGLTNKDVNLNVKQVDEGLALMRQIINEEEAEDNT